MVERLLLYRGELVLANSAKWAYPIVWDVLEGCSWGNAAIRVAYCWVIYPTTYVTYILLHNVSVFEVNTALISLLSIKSDGQLLLAESDRRYFPYRFSLMSHAAEEQASCLIDVCKFTILSDRFKVFLGK